MYNTLLKYEKRHKWKYHRVSPYNTYINVLYRTTYVEYLSTQLRSDNQSNFSAYDYISTLSCSIENKNLIMSLVTCNSDAKRSSPDKIIFSSRKIPGNEISINNLMNKLIYKGVEIITPVNNDIHVSGHFFKDIKVL